MVVLYGRKAAVTLMTITKIAKETATLMTMANDDDAEDAGDRNSSTPGISFRVQTENFQGTHLSSSSKPFQIFKINGIFEVKVSVLQLHLY